MFDYSLLIKILYYEKIILFISDHSLIVNRL